MHEARKFIYGLLIVSVALALTTNHLIVDGRTFLYTVGLLWVFTILYDHFKLIVTSKTTEQGTYIDYGINYSLTIAIFAGPLGLLIFEIIIRLTEYINKKRTKTAEQYEFIHTLYNIGSFTLNGTVGYYLFYMLEPSFQLIPFGFWILLFLLLGIMSITSDLLIIIIFKLLKEINTKKEAIDFIKTRSILDMGKVSVTNALLLYFLQERQWEIIVCLLILNYLVSRSFLDKAQSMQHKIERDKFEQLAYTDFLTDLHNRAYMGKIMDELGTSNETIGIVVADIDKFKQINDTYNHAVGDKVIKQFASTLKNSLTKDDYVFRSGGEEFTLFLRKKSFSRTESIVKSIKQATETTPVDVEYKGMPESISYTASFGLYFFKINNESFSINKGYVAADQLLLHSKKLGRNRVSTRNGTVYTASTPATK
ncbi:GGDEF domain-containing protein [Virgibacillus flavescens]|uniref:GGDEF domain-containing protein n=1 Tax=Virgibacillus flavescens TaxID=1611422 RepID=UPI003D34077A